MKKKNRLFNLLPNTDTKNMYSITPSHNIQQKADMKKYCKSAATNLQTFYSLLQVIIVKLSLQLHIPHY